MATVVLALLSHAATATAQSPQTLVYDEFTGPQSSSLASHVPNVSVTGDTWTIGGGPSIVLNMDTVRPSASGASNVFATIESGAADVNVLVWWYASNYTSTPTGGVVFRYVDSTNYYVAHFWQELVYLSKMTPSGLVHVGSAGAGYPYGAWHSLEVRAVGSTVNVYWDDYHRIQATDSTNQAATRHGVWWWNQHDYLSEIGSFRVTGTPVPPVASATASPNPLQLPVNGAKVVTATGYSASGAAIPTARFTWMTSNAAVASIQSTTDNTAKIVGGAVGTASITATAQSGVTVNIPVTVTSTCIGVCVQDEFTGLSNASLAPHVPDVNVMGGPWTLGAEASIVHYSTGVRAGNLGSGRSHATIDAGAANGSVAMSWLPVTGEDASIVNGGLIFRFVDDNNYLLASYWQNRVYLNRQTSSGFMELGSAAVLSPYGSWHGLEVRLDGPNIQVWWDGEQKIQATDWTNVSSTRHGISWANVDAGSIIDGFTVTGAPPPPPVSSVVASPASLTLPAGGAKSAAATGYTSSGAVVPSATFSWATSNPGIATVQATGPTSARIVGVAIGNATITVTSSDGPDTDIPVTITSTCIGLCVQDAFTGLASVSIATHVPDVNVMGGSWTLAGNQPIIHYGSGVRVADFTSGPVFATIESGASRGRIGINWLPVTGVDSSVVNGGVVFRFVDQNSYFLASYWREQVYLHKRVGGSFVTLSSAAVAAPFNAWHGLEVRLDGPSIELWWDGEKRTQAVDWSNLDATEHGILWDGLDPGSIIDDFTVTGDGPPPPVASVVVTPTEATLPVAGSRPVTAVGYSGTNAWVPSATFTWSTSDASVATVQSTGPTTARVTGVATGTTTITAHSIDGPSSSQFVTITATCLDTCVHDSFTGTGDLESHTPDTDVMGSGWTVVGAPGINVAGAYLTPAAQGSGTVLATIESGTANGSVGATWTPLTGSAVVSPTFGVVVRYVSSASYLLATYENSKVRLYKAAASSFELVAEAAVYDAVGSTHGLEVRLDGPGVQVWWDGQQRIQAVDHANITATRHGLYWHLGTDPASRVEDFGVTGGLVSVPTSVTVSPPPHTLPAGDGKWLSASAFTSGGVWIPWTSFTWHTSNSSVATVQGSGLHNAYLTAVGSGTTTITATSTEGLSATIRVLVTVEDNEAGVRVYDSFSEGGGLSISTHVPDENVDSQPWAVVGSVGIGMYNGRIRANGNGTVDYGTIDSGTADGTVSVIWRPVLGDAAPNPGAGLIFRYVNAQSYWVAFYWKRGLYLRKMTPTGFTDVASDYVGEAVNATHQFAVILDGPQIQVWWDGYLRMQVTDPLNEAATRHGVMWNSVTDAGSWMDDFKVNTDFITPVRPPQPPMPCINGVWPQSGQSWATAGGTDAVTLSAPGECAWMASSTVPWIHITTPSGVGDAYVEYSVEPNTGGARFGAIVFENSDWSFPIAQAPGGTLMMAFQVLDASTQLPVSGASVTLSPNYGGLGPSYTDTNGRVSYVVDGGPLQYTISKTGYVTLNDGMQVTQADTRLIMLHPSGPVYGCLDPYATNYNGNATIDDGSCLYDPSSDPIVNNSLQVLTPSHALVVGNSWITPINNAQLHCSAEVVASNALINVFVTIRSSQGFVTGPITNGASGVGRARAVAILPNVYNESPAEFTCEFRSYVNGVPQPMESRKIWSRGYVGAYFAYGYGGSPLPYRAEPGCNHEGMFYSDLEMELPIPGFPDLNNPPPYMLDRGFKVYGPFAGSPFYIRSFRPSASPLCQAPQ